MSGTQVKQVRRIVEISGANQYEVVTTCLAPGSLPDTSLFVFDITDSSDPKNDTFVQLAQVQDFGAYPATRAAAVAAGATRYRTTSLVKRYVDIDAANQAWKEISSSVNTLVTQYDAYLTEFATPTVGQVYVYPTVDESMKQSLIDAYKAANAAVAPAEDARNTELAECTAIEKDLKNTELRITDAENDYAAMLPISGASHADLTVYQATYSNTNTATTQIRAVNTGSTASAGDKNAIETSVLTIESNLTQMNNVNTAFTNTVITPVDAQIAVLRTRLASLRAEQITLQSKLNKCNATCATLQGQLDAAKIARDAALAELLSVCPDYVP